MFQWVYALAQNILFCSRIVSTQKAVSRTVIFTRVVRVFVCVCVLGGVTEFRSSIIPDWHQLESEVFTAATPASASDSWDKKDSWRLFFGSSDVCQKSTPQLQSPLPVLLRSQQSLRPLKKQKQKKKQKRFEWEETFGTCNLYFIKTHCPVTHLLFLLLLSLTAGWALKQSLYMKKKRREKWLS